MTSNASFSPLVFVYLVTEEITQVLLIHLLLRQVTESLKVLLARHSAVPLQRVAHGEELTKGLMQLFDELRKQHAPVDSDELRLLCAIAALVRNPAFAPQLIMQPRVGRQGDMAFRRLGAERNKTSD